MAVPLFPPLRRLVLSGHPFRVFLSTSLYDARPHGSLTSTSIFLLCSSLLNSFVIAPPAGLHDIPFVSSGSVRMLALFRFNILLYFGRQEGTI